jgi:formiminotetrahydrofolate cyclodeaminase
MRGLEAYVTELNDWLQDLATRPLPGASAAGAVAAAMGAALLAKATAITLQHQAEHAPDRSLLAAILDQAQSRRTDFLRWAQADEQAYRAVLDTRTLEADTPARQQAWQAATEVPIQIAEACQSLLSSVSHLQGLCWPAVQPELQTGVSLLEVGRAAGILAAETNLWSWAGSPTARQLEARIHALKRECKELMEDRK